MAATMTVAAPRWHTELTGDDPTQSWAQEIESAAKRLGVELMPWQSEAARLIGARTEGGRPRYKTVVVSVPRQQGKTLLARAVLSARAAQADGLQLFTTAQSRMTAARSVVTLGRHLIDGGADVKVLYGIGQESVTWPNGSVIRPVAPNERGGHGESIDMMLLDEAWTVTAELMGGVRPAMLARPDSQLLVISTMGTVTSHVWNGIVTRGREATGDPKSTIAYVEYSAPSDDAISERDLWASWMPALGITVGVDDVATTLEDLEAAEAVRALGNRTTATLSILFNPEWVEKAWQIISPPETMTLGVDVNDEPYGATVAAAFTVEEGQPAARVIEWRHGSPRWIPDLVADIIARRQVDAIAIDPGGPARQLRDELAAIADTNRIPFVERTVRDYCADCAGFHADLRDQKLILEKSDVLSDALVAAQRRTVGDLWLVARSRMTIDASPLIAVILAHGTAEQIRTRPINRPFVL